jgi:hypothetical protein
MSTNPFRGYCIILNLTRFYVRSSESKSRQCGLQKPVMKSITSRIASYLVSSLSCSWRSRYSSKRRYISFCDIPSDFSALARVRSASKGDESINALSNLVEMSAILSMPHNEPNLEPVMPENQAASFIPFSASSIRATTSDKSQTWSAIPASIAGVTRRLAWILQKL